MVKAKAALNHLAKEKETKEKEKEKARAVNLNRRPNKSANIGTQEIVLMAQVASTTIQRTAGIG